MNCGRRLAPGKAIGALEEAIRIIREIWAADQRGRLADLEEMNKYIDEGAATVGRDPSKVRRELVTAERARHSEST